MDKYVYFAYLKIINHIKRYMEILFRAVQYIRVIVDFFYGTGSAARQKSPVWL